MTWLVFSVCLLLLALQGEATNPGLRARITKKGFDYANTVAIDALKASVEQIKIPDQSGEQDHVSYQVRNIRVTGFSPPQSSLSTVAGEGLSWRGTGAGIGVAGDFKFKVVFIKGSGSFTASVKDVNFDIVIKIGEDSNGRPSISSQPTECSASIGDISFQFHGDASALLNIFKGKVAAVIRDQLNGQMCNLIEMEINKDGASKLAGLPVTTTLADNFLLDYRLVQEPLATADFLETFHKGEVYWQDTTTEAPMAPHAMANTSDTDHMLYFWVSDYVFNTMMYAGQKHGVLTHDLTAQDLPAGSRGVLDTSCSGLIPKCVGGLIPQIADKYPNSQVELRITSTEMPKMTITPAGVSVVGAGNIDMFAQVKGRKDTPFLVSLFATMSCTVDVSLQNELLHFKVKDLSLNLKAGKSAVGPIHDFFLSFLIKEALNVYFIPKLNDIGEKGFPLPVTKDIKFVNSQVSFAQDTIMVATDLTFSPSIVDKDDDDDDTLKFIPHQAAAGKHVRMQG